MRSECPATQSQQEIWLADQAGEGASLAYCQPFRVRLRGNVDIQALAQAVRALPAKHEALTATFHDGGQLMRFNRQWVPQVPVTDLRDMARADAERFLDELYSRAAETHFDLENGPLFWAEVVCSEPDVYQVVMSAHHIICDGWSYKVIVEDLATLYDSYKGGADPDLSVTDSFEEYAIECEDASESEIQRRQQYWLDRFKDIPADLDLPADHARPAVRTYDAMYCEHQLPDALARSLQEAGQQLGANTFSALFSAFAVLVGRLGNASDFVIGVPTAGQLFSGRVETVGYCVNFVPIRINLAGAETLEELAEQLHMDLIEAVDHQPYPYARMIREIGVAPEASRLPLSSIVFNYFDAGADTPPGFGDLKVDAQFLPRPYENFEFFLNIVNDSSGIRLAAQVNTDLYERSTIERWFRSFEVILERFVADPDAALVSVPVIAEDEQQQLRAWSDNRVAGYQAPGLLPLLQAGKQSQTARYRDASREESAQSLWARADAVAAHLRASGVKAGDWVGILLSRHLGMLESILAIAKIGASFVPLDPKYPADRLSYMISDANASTLLTERSLLSAIGLRDDNAIDYFDIDFAARDESAEASAAVSEQHPLYVYYTSGSTGRPKGVVVPRAAVAFFLESMRDAPGIRPQDHWLATTTLSFDPAIMELLMPLTVGASITIADEDQVSTGTGIRNLLESGDYSIFQATPGRWRMLLDAGWAGSPGLKGLIGGEALSRDLAGQLCERTSELWNVYGPTETTVWATAARIDADAAWISIGQPRENTILRVLDKELRECPIGVPGEICIGGPGVADGYSGLPELTAKQFIADPVGRPEDRIYKTGDLGRWRANGELEHLGRLDFQVKIRGHRIELGEIESVLAEHPAVSEVVVIAREFKPDDYRMIAYVVTGEDETSVTAAQLKAHVSRQLPDYMLPQYIERVDHFPRLPNGKVDRKSLPDVNITDNVVASSAPPTSADGQALAAIWQELLGLSSVGLEDKFFDLGGHSMLAVQACLRFERETGRKLKPQQLVFETLAELVGEKLAGAGTDEHGSPDAQASNQATLLRFGPENAQIAGVYQPSQEVGHCRAAVLFCAPFGQEAIRAYPSFRVMAQRLAQHGIASLRFDYFGAGESDGDDEEFSLAACVQNIVTASEKLRALSGADKVIWLGLRVGANLVSQAAGIVGQKPDAICYWEPVADGDQYIHELADAHRVGLARAFSLGQDSAATGGRANQPTHLDEALGFSITASLGKELSALGVANFKAMQPVCTELRLFGIGSAPPSTLEPLLTSASGNFRFRQLTNPTKWAANDGGSLVPADVTSQLIPELIELSK